MSEKLWATHTAAVARYRGLTEKASASGIDAVFVKPRTGLVIVGGPRNRSGALPQGAKNAITAAYKAVIRAENALKETMKA